MLYSSPERKIDIIFCLDGTGSMHAFIEKFKLTAEKFYMDFVAKMVNGYDYSVDELNIKVITFRDYTVDGNQAMVQSGWYDITAGDDVEYEEHLNGIIAEGGGDEPENGLEALFYAMTSDWNVKDDRDKQIIVLFTDADAVPFGTHNGHPNYPTDMVDADGLVETWMGICPTFLNRDSFKLKERCKKMVIFAPAGTIYETMLDSCNRSHFVPVQREAGLGDISFDEIVEAIAAPVSPF